MPRKKYTAEFKTKADDLEEEKRPDAEDDWPADIGALFSSGLISPSLRIPA